MFDDRTMISVLAGRIARQGDLSPIDLRDHTHLLFSNPDFLTDLAREYEELTDGDETLRAASSILFADWEFQGLALYLATCPMPTSAEIVVQTHLPNQRLVFITASRDGVQSNARGVTAKELRKRQLSKLLQDMPDDYRVWSTFYTVLWQRIQRLTNAKLRRELQGYLVMHQNGINAERVGYVYAELDCTDKEVAHDKGLMRFA